MNRPRLLWTLLAITTVAAALSGYVDQAGEEYAARAFKRALVTFAVARTLNGAISVAQGTEVAVEPGGVGVNFSVGQILDPINDLVEQFSGVMLVATSSLGLQNILLDITGWWGASALLVAAALGALVAVWWPRLEGTRTAQFALRFLLLTVFLRFAVPLLIIGSNVVFDAFLVAEQQSATQALEATGQEIEQLSRDPQATTSQDQSLLDRFSAMLDESLAALNVSERLQQFRERVSNATEHIINLIVIFILQTIVLPIVFVWLLAEALKNIAARATRLDSE